MSDAERQAHAAAEFDEATAMRRGGLQPVEDLERALAEVDQLLAADEYPDVLGAAIREHWPTLRAALERLSQLEDVVTRMDREVEGHIELVVETQRSRNAALARERELREALEELVRGSGLLALSEYWAAVSRAKTLLAQPAAGEERERG